MKSESGGEKVTELFTVCVIYAVIFVNGATDAPNSISGAVASGALSYRSACVLCAVFNFAGLCVSYMFFPAVADTMASLKGSDSIIPMVTVVIFAVAAWVLGIPTSESHALVAAVGGVSLYALGRPDARFIDICIKSAVSCAAGFASGGIVTAFAASALHLRQRLSRKVQILCAALSSACHGMQDGQKFVLLLAPVSASGRLSLGSVLLCSAVMGLGCLSGGRKMTDTVGAELVPACSRALSTCADMGAVMCTLASSFFGIPVSTTYMKTCTLMGAASVGRARVSGKVARRLFAVWILTYPVCMAIAYALCRVLDESF